MTAQAMSHPEQTRLFGIVTTLACLLALGPLLLTSREMWDGVASSYALAIKDDSITYAWLVDSNWYVTYGLVRAAHWLEFTAVIPSWVSLKLWNSAMILLIAYETTLLARNLLQLPHAMARWCFPLVVSFPIWYVFFSYTPMSAHLFCAWIGLAGYRLLQNRSLITKAFAGLAVIVSFQLASNCIFLPTVAFAHLVLLPDRRSERLRLALFVLAAAIGAFFATRVIWPPSQAYVGYNTILNPATTSMFHYLKYVAMFGSWTLLMVPGLATALLMRFRYGEDALVQTPLHSKPDDSESLIQGLILCCLLGAAAAAYIAVGLGSPLFVVNVDRAPSFSAALARNMDGSRLGVWYGGWGARQLILFLIPLCMATVWLVTIITRRQKLGPGSGKASRVASLALGICVLFNLIWLLPGHWAKLARHAEETVIVNWLKAHPAPPPGKVDIVLAASFDYVSLVYEANYLLFLSYGFDSWAAAIFPDRPDIRQAAYKLRQDVLSTPESTRNLLAGQNLMKSYDWKQECLSSVNLTLPKLSAVEILWTAAHSPTDLPQATAQKISSDCPDAPEPWRHSHRP